MVSGAQTSRPDNAGPVRRLLGGMASPAASFCFCECEGKKARLPFTRTERAVPRCFRDLCKSARVEMRYVALFSMKQTRSKFKQDRPPSHRSTAAALIEKKAQTSRQK